MRSLILCLFFLSFTAQGVSCTAFQLQSQDGAYVYCRSMEYSVPLKSDILVVGQNTAFGSSLAKSEPCLKWQTKYGYVGLNQKIAQTLVSDGMNEKGLVVGSLYLQGFAKYQPYESAKASQTLGPWELTSYLLGTCATVDEVKEALKELVVVHEPMPGLGDFILPLHFYVCDQNGQALVVEYLEGRLCLYENLVAVLTNGPPFSWHMINLKNYVKMSPLNSAKLNLKSIEVNNQSEGTGLLGLPGDFTPPSRFVRAVFYSQWAKPQKTADATVSLGFHILNTFDIFDGIVRAKVEPQGERNDITEWVIVNDQQNRKTYVRSYESLQIQMVDLKKVPLDRAGFQTIPLKKQLEVVDDSLNLKPLVIP